MRIVAEYDMATVKGNGCGGVELGGQMYVNSGGRPGVMEHLSMYGFDVYRFPLGAFRAGGAKFSPNMPAPTVVFRSDEGDSHGAVVTKGGRYLWVADRKQNAIVVVDTATDQVVNRIELAGRLSDDPSPDLLDLSPSGNRVYASLRGPTPLTGDPHVSTGSSPGVAVIRVEAGGRSGTLQSIARVSRVVGGVETADPHALQVRSTK